MDIERFEDLREKAKKLINDPNSNEKIRELLSKDLDVLLEELQIYQAEFERQNEELLVQQRELSETQRRMSKLFDYTPVGYLILDEQNKIIKCNDKSATLLAGGNSNQIIEKNFERFILNGIGNFMEWVVRDEEVPLELKISGSEKALWVRLDKNLREDNGKNYTLLTLIDITSDLNIRSKLIETQYDLEELTEHLVEEVDREVRKNVEQEKILIRQSHFAAMGEMISAIAHQWRQPLNLIGILIQDLREAYLENEINELYLKNMIRRSMEQLKHLSGTINVFRNFFTPDKEITEFQIENIFKELEKLLDASMKDGNIILETFIDNKIYLCGYPNELKQALINIVNNAKDAILENNKSDGRISLHASTDSGTVYISILDNGGGIPEHAFEKILDPYFTTKGKEKGTGIGLYMTRSIIESSLNGNLFYENISGGAKFTIVLPHITNQCGE